MATLNKVLLIGKLDNDPIIRQTPSGRVVAAFSLTTMTKYTKKNGEIGERANSHQVILVGQLAETARDGLAGGKTVFIEGRLENRTWKDKHGNDRITTEIIGEKMQILKPKTPASQLSDL